MHKRPKYKGNKDSTVKFINNLQSKTTIERKIESKKATTLLFFLKLQLSKVMEKVREGGAEEKMTKASVEEK